jgi:hypothetical protein
MEEGREGERRRESTWREKEVGEGDEEEKEGVCPAGRLGRAEGVALLSG